jgi:hypothetical protein
VGHLREQGQAQGRVDLGVAKTLREHLFGCPLRSARGNQ